MCNDPNRKRFPEAAPEQARCEYCGESFAGEAALSFHSCPHPTPQPSAEPPCTHLAYTVNWAGRFEGPIVCDGCGLTGTAKRLRPSHDSDFSIHWVTPQPSAEPQTNAAGIDIKKFRMSEKGWTCRVCRDEVVSPAHPMFHVCATPSAGERCGRVNWFGTSVCTMPKGHTGDHSRDYLTTWPESETLPDERVPTPAEGERKHGPFCVPTDCLCPTPSAGEEKYPCADCGVMRTKAEGGTTFTVCDACWDKHYRGVSAGETKCTCPTEALYHHGDCPFAILYHKTPDQTERDLRAVGARPEESECVWCRLSHARCPAHTTAITPAERDFLRALADHWKGVSDIDPNIPPHNSFDRVTRAARRVVEEAARRVTA